MKAKNRKVTITVLPFMQEIYNNRDTYFDDDYELASNEVWQIYDNFTRRKRMKILIATKNPGKIEGAKKALQHYFKNIEIKGIPVESDVPDQPVNKEIYEGAKNRVKNLKKYAKENNIKADLFLGIESGINDLLGRWMITNIAVIEDNEDFESYGTSPSFPVPDNLVQKVLDTNLSEAMNSRLGEDKERHNHSGGIQLLTHNEISRIDLTEYAFIMALTKYINGENWR